MPWLPSGTSHGTATIPDASATVEVTHGLGATPTSITVTGRSVEALAVTARDETTFTVERAGTTGALQFDWISSGLEAPVPIPDYTGQTLRTYGHSYALTSGDATTNWPAELASTLGMTLTNGAVGGDVAQQTVIDRMFEGSSSDGWTPLETDVVVLNAMINDVRRVGLGTNAVDRWSDIIEAAVHFARCGSAFGDADASITKSGTWSNSAGTNRIGGGVANTSAAGAYYEITFDGDAITIYTLTFRSDVGASGVTTFTDTSDGSVIGTHDCGPANGMPANYPTSWTVTPLHFDGFGPGTHTIRGTRTSGTIFLDAYSLPSPTPPLVVLVKDQDLPSWTTGNNAAPWNQGSDAAIAAYKAALDAIAAAFPSGEVITTETSPTWDDSTMVSADGVHPNDTGVDAYTDGIETALLAL